MKSRILIILLLVSSFAFAQIPTSNLQAMYEFTGGSFADAANGINFTQTGTALTTENDRFAGANNALSLNGDYLTRSDLNFGGTSTFTITWSFWIKTTTNTTDVKTILDDSSRNTVVGFDSDDVGYYIYLRNGQLGFSSRYYEGNFAVPTQPVGYGHLFPTVIADGNWHHVVVLFNPTFISGVQRINSKIYVDGVENAKSSIETGIVTSPNTNGNITLANSRSNHLPAINTYADNIDDIYAYNRVLTQTEIEQIRDIGNYCFKPDTNLISASNITQTTVDINITGTDTYDLAYHKASDPFSSAIIIPNVSTGITNLTGLDVFTEYNVYLRQQCVVTTAWSDSILFKTGRPIGRLYVNTAATGGNTGIDWANALNSLTDALAIVEANEEIWVAQGLYKADASDRAISFEIAQDDIKIYGGFNGTETNLSGRDFINNTTILSGDLLGNDDSILDFVNTTRDDNSYNIVNVTANNTIIDGFTITDAHANGSASTQKSGGAIFKGSTVANLSVYNCAIKNNVATTAGAGINAQQNINGTLKVYSNIFKNNLARYATAIYSYTSNNFTANVNVVNSIFYDNVAKNNGSTLGYAGSAGWYRALGSSSTMNCKLVNNTYSGNVDLGTASSLNNFTRATIGMGYTNGTFNGEVSNCIFWGNTTAGGVTSRSIAQMHDNLGQNIAVDYSIDENNFASIPPANVTNSTNTDPLFTNSGSQDFSLQAGSPAIDSGDTTVLPFEVSFDTSGNPRVYNGVIDMGAIEVSCTGTCYQLTINVIGSGFLENNGTALTSVSLYNQNEVVNLQAIGNLGYAFSQWSGDATGNTNPLSVTMDADKTITVTFVQSEIYVDIDATAGLNDGSSWANAFTDLRIALNAVIDENSVIWVAEGTYKPGVSGANRNSNFTVRDNGLKVYGGFNGTETMLSQRDIVAHPTILSGDLNSNDTAIAITHPSRNDNALHVVFVNANDILLDGLTIKDGHANSGSINYGAGIYISNTNTSLHLKDCNIYRNASTLQGSGIRANYSVDSNLIIENCHIDRNHARYGAGLYVAVSNASAVNVNISNSLFTFNLTRNFTNADLGYTGSSAWIRANGTNSIVTATVSNSTFSKNTDAGTQSNSQKGTLAFSRRTDETSTFNVSLNNSIIYNNIATGNVVGPDINRGHTLMPNQVLVKNAIGQSSFSNINAANLTNTSNADPLFTSTSDFTLQAGSPAIDSGDNSLVPSGIATDLAGNDRIFNTTVDMGVYEFGSTLDVDNFEAQVSEFKIYPNPTSNVLNVKMNESFNKAEIFNIQGQKVLESNTKNLNVSNLSSGLYLIQIEATNGVTQTKRFIKQ